MGFNSAFKVLNDHDLILSSVKDLPLHHPFQSDSVYEI